VKFCGAVGKTRLSFTIYGVFQTGIGVLYVGFLRGGGRVDKGRRSPSKTGKSLHNDALCKPERAAKSSQRYSDRGSSDNAGIIGKGGFSKN